MVEVDAALLLQVRVEPVIGFLQREGVLPKQNMCTMYIEVNVQTKTQTPTFFYVKTHIRYI